MLLSPTCLVWDLSDPSELARVALRRVVDVILGVMEECTAMPSGNAPH